MAKQNQAKLTQALSKPELGLASSSATSESTPVTARMYSAPHLNIVSLSSISDECRRGAAAGERSPKPVDSLNLGFAGQPNQCDYHRTPISQRAFLLSSGAIKHNSPHHRDEESPIVHAELDADNALPEDSYRPYSYLYYHRFRKAFKVLGVESYPEFATAKPLPATPASRSSRPAPHPKMTSPRAMEPSTDLEKGELRPLLAPTSTNDHDDNSSIDLDTANEATTSSLLTTIATSTTTLCSALLISLYRHPVWLQHLLDLSRMPCSHPNHQPSHFITEIPRPVFLAAVAIHLVSVAMLYAHRRARGDAHQDALLAAGLLMGVTAGLGLGFGLEDVVRVAGVWAVSGALVGSAVGHEVLALVTAGEDEDDAGGADGEVEEMVGRRGSVMSAVAGEFGAVWRERGGRS